MDTKRPGKKPLYVYYMIAAIIIVLLNVLLVPALQERSVERTNYTTFIKSVEKGYVKEVNIDTDFIYYVVEKDGTKVMCKTAKQEDPDLVRWLYDEGVSTDAPDPQKQSGTEHQPVLGKLPVSSVLCR